MPKKLIVLSEHSIEFPDPNLAMDEPAGLLAIGGDLSINRLINAYQHAIFPWFSKGEPILWWSPPKRAIIAPTQVHISKSMSKFIRQTSLTVTVNHAFEEVINACALPRKTQAETWISPAIKRAYIALHQAGKAHSIEVWNNKELVGGLYGINVGTIFCGESMFHIQANASKLAFIGLCQHFSMHAGKLIDCQMMTPHLQSLGVTENTRNEFLTQLANNKASIINNNCWHQQPITIATKKVNSTSI